MSHNPRSIPHPRTRSPPDRSAEAQYGGGGISAGVGEMLEEDPKRLSISYETRGRRPSPDLEHPKFHNIQKDAHARLEIGTSSSRALADPLGPSHTLPVSSVSPPSYGRSRHDPIQPTRPAPVIQSKSAHSPSNAQPLRHAATDYPPQSSTTQPQLMQPGKRSFLVSSS